MSMLQPGLIDPIERERTMHDDELLKYVRIRDAELSAGTSRVKERDIQFLRDQFYRTHEIFYYRGFLDHIWETVEPRLRENNGLTQFTIDHDGAKSEYFLPWLIEVNDSPSGALELAYGAGYDLVGQWHRSIPDDDPIMAFVRDDPMFVYNRERELFIANLVTTAQIVEGDKGPDHICKVIDLGAGRLAWARWHGFTFSPSYQQIYAFDHDNTIHPADLFNDDLAELGLHYQLGTIETALADPVCQNANLVILVRAASYFPFETFIRSVVVPVYYLLAPEGTFFFDLQIDCPCLQRNVSIFDWPPMAIESTATETMDSIEAARRVLWQDGRYFRAEYSLDTYNMSPTSIMVTFQKIG